MERDLCRNACFFQQCLLKALSVESTVLGPDCCSSLGKRLKKGLSLTFTFKYESKGWQSQSFALCVFIPVLRAWVGSGDTWQKQPGLTSQQSSLWHNFDNVNFYLFIYFLYSVPGFYVKSTHFLDISEFGAHSQYCDEKSQINTMSGSKLESLGEVGAVHMHLPFNSLFKLWNFLSVTASRQSYKNKTCHRSLFLARNIYNPLARIKQTSLQSSFKYQIENNEAFQSYYILPHQTEFP